MIASLEDRKPNRDRPVVAILIHDMFEDWLESIGVSLQSFCTAATGSWWFNYAQALDSVDVSTIFIATSSRIDEAVRYVHGPTGAVFWVLPTPRLATWIRRLLVRRFDRSPRDPGSRVERLHRWIDAVGRHAASYVSTPLAALRRLLQSERCAALLVEEFEYPRFDVAVLLGHRMGLRVFGTFCGGRPQAGWRRPLRSRAFRLCAGLAICATCELERVKAQYGVPPSKLALIQYPVDLSIWFPGDKQAERAALGIEPAAKVVIYHGAIVFRTKGVGVLLDGWERISGDHPDEDLRLIMIGTGGDAPEVQRILEERNLRGVQWINRWEADRSVIRTYLSAADVYAFPSLSDACPVSVAEALACGLPVVASDIRGIPDLVPEREESGGILIPPGDPEAFRAAVNRLLNDEALASELGGRGRAHAQRAFSMQSIGKQLKRFLLSDESGKRIDSGANAGA